MIPSLGLSLLKPEFFTRSEITKIAAELIGKILISNIGGEPTAGIIVETEAYSGTDDRACHAHNKKRTPRTETMFLEGGHTYVYLCYGMHHLFNVVTNVEGEPDAVLIRALQPIDGMEAMAQRRGLPENSLKISRGPACLSQALGINKSHNALNLITSEVIQIYEAPKRIAPIKIVSSKRIGVDFAGKDSEKLWRFYENGNPWVSSRPTQK